MTETETPASRGANQDIVMQRIGELIRTQDNRATDAPIFIVQQRKRIYGMSSEYADEWVWIDTGGDFDEADELEHLGLDAKHDNGEDTGDWSKTYYRDIWEFVTACFTEQGCQDYIDANGHNLSHPRIYACGSWRNEEFRQVREFLKTA